jgi:hypothetical protein
VNSHERVRVEVAFEGGQAITLNVSLVDADTLEEALAQERNGSLSVESEGGRYTLVLRRVVYVKRFARDSRVGFGAV